MKETDDGGGMGTLVPFFAANILFGSGLFAHAFLYNFYLDELGFGESAMGLAAAALTAGGLLALAPAGLALDRWGARRVYLGAVILAATGLALGAWVETAPAVLAAAAVAGLGTASWRVAMGPVLMQIAGPRVRSRAFSWNVALLLGSGALWTGLSGAVSAWSGSGSALGGLRTALWLGAAGTALAGAAFLLVGRLEPESGGDGGARSEARRWWSLSALAVPRNVALLAGAIFVWMLGAALVLPFFNLYFQRVHGMEVEVIGGVFAVAQALTAMVVFGGGELAQRWGPRRAFGVWAVLFPVVLLALVAGPGLGVAIVLFVCQGLPSPATNPLLDEIVLETAPRARQGAASSWRNGATEASGLVGASLGGVVLEQAGFPPLLTLAAVVATLGAWVLWRAFRSDGRVSEGGVGRGPR